MSEMWTRVLVVLPLLAAAAWAHPMGNFSVSHYTLIRPGAKAVEVTYALDIAELPTVMLMQDWKLDAATPRPELEAKASEQAREWMNHLTFTAGGKAISPRFERAELVITDGAGGLKVMRITSHLRLPAAPGALDFEDHNYEGRAGWKEIVIQPGPGASIVKASQTDEDRSKGLSQYPADPTAAPPQDLRASLEWSTLSAPVTTAQRPPVIAPVPQPAPPVIQKSAPPPSASADAKSAATGTVTKNDFLSRLLSRKELTLWMMIVGLCVAFGFGAIHALSPGHGKTIVAAYLVGSRGTVKHAALLGAMVTFTHTISVFLLGLATLFLSRYVVPERIYPVLGAISGLSIVAVGLVLFVRRLRAVNPHTHGQHHHSHDHAHDHVHAHAAAAHGHDHSHDHGHVHDHDHVHDHHHTHDHHAHDGGHEHTHTHDHHHGPGGHSHYIEGDVTMGSLIALGASGGLVPCPSALVLLLAAISFGRIAFGLTLLVAFSLGLAVVLMGIGVLVIYAKHLLPDPKGTSRHPFFRLVPVLSAGVVVCVGVLMTGVALGWIRPGLAG